MFKPGEKALIRGYPEIITITDKAPPENSDFQWPVSTSEGFFEETDLLPAHPSVRATAEGREYHGEENEDPILPQATKGENQSPEEKEKAKAKLGAYFEDSQKLSRILAKITDFEWNGHWKNGSSIRKDFKFVEELFRYGRFGLASKEDVKALLRATKNKMPLDHWVPLNVSLSTSGLRSCSSCSSEDLVLETNGLVLRLTGTPCPFPNGLPPVEWELNVPSGKLVVANDLRALFPLPGGEDFDINSETGCQQTSRAYSENGLSHAFVGNTCPGVYRCEKGFKIANPPSEEKWDGKAYVEVVPRPVFEGERVTGICTDLWWYSICDYDEFKRRCKHFKRKASDFHVETVEVKPGVYRFRHNARDSDDDYEAEIIYSTFEWVRKPDPVKDFLAQYESGSVNAHAYVQASVAAWPTLFGAGKGKGDWASMTAAARLSSWQRVADHVFCVIGGGVDWHEKGFPRASVDVGIPDIDPPAFREQHHWYPFSKPYGGLFEPKVLSPSFAKLAFRVLESVISFGTRVQDSEKSRDVVCVRERMLGAVKRYRELMAKYPEQADPKYVAWLQQKGRAESWVRHFDLGPEYTEKHRKHAQKQRWVPEDAYAVAFDARELKDGHFAWHPKKGGCWSTKKDAQRYAILEHEDNGQEGRRNCFWSSNAGTSVPLYSVARVVKVGDVSHMGETLVEIAYDYGTSWMKNTEKRKALVEMNEKAGIRILSKAEYDKLLPEAKAFFDASEASVKKEG